MPILGKDYRFLKEVKFENQIPTKEDPFKIGEIKSIKANHIHPSTILPKSRPSQEVINSVKRIGQQQPIIVRPYPQKLGDYEMIDGNSRFLGVIGGFKSIRFYSDETAPDVRVDVRYALSDSQIFRLYYSTKKKKRENTFERAVFFHQWLITKANELGTQEGAKTEVARELVEDETSLDSQRNPQLFAMKVNSKRSLLSQYSKVYEVITKLEQKYPNEDFEFLKMLSVNKLYALSKRLDDMSVLKEIVDKIEKNPKMKLERIKDLLTRKQRIVENVPTYALNVSITEEMGKSLHKTVYNKNKDIFFSTKSTKRILGDVVRQLVELFLIYPDKYEMELEKTKDENKLKAIWHTNT